MLQFQRSLQRSLQLCCCASYRWILYYLLS